MARKSAGTPLLKTTPPRIYKRENHKEATVVNCVRLDTVTEASHRISHSSVPDAVPVTTVSQPAESAGKSFAGITAHLLLSG